MLRWATSIMQAQVMVDCSVTKTQTLYMCTLDIIIMNAFVAWQSSRDHVYSVWPVVSGLPGPRPPLHKPASTPRGRAVCSPHAISHPSFLGSSNLPAPFLEATSGPVAAQDPAGAMPRIGSWLCCGLRLRVRGGSTERSRRVRSGCHMRLMQRSGRRLPW